MPACAEIFSPIRSAASAPRFAARSRAGRGCALLLSTLVAATALAQPPSLPLGSQFQVNTYTSGSQNNWSVATDADGDFVVTWFGYDSSGTDTSESSVQGQRYASDGSPLSGEFQINTYTTGIQLYPSVAMDADGAFIVVWASAGSSGNDTSISSIQGQRYASDGSAMASEFQINTYTSSLQTRPSVAVDSSGDFVVVWESFGSSGTDSSEFSIQGQRYASDGSSQGSEFQINTHTTSTQFSAVAEKKSNGDFVVAWTSETSSGTDSSGLSIQGQRFASNGSAMASEFQINTNTTGYQIRPSLAMESDGDFVVAWGSESSSGTDNSVDSVQVRRFASDGSPRGSDFQINVTTFGNQNLPSVAMDADDNFVVVWESYFSSSDTSGPSILGRHIGSDGSPLGAEFQVNTYTSNGQGFPSVSSNGDGNFVVTWTSFGSDGTDTSLTSVQAQLFGRPLFADGFDATGDTSRWTSTTP